MKDDTEKEKISVKNKLFIGLIIAMAIFACGATIYIISSQVNDIKTKIQQGEAITTTTIQLKSVNNRSSQAGNFFLGCGRVGKVDYYVCYEINSDGGIKLIKLDTEKTTIYEKLEDSETAYAEISKKGWGDIVAIKMYLPKNTIKTEYDLST